MFYRLPNERKTSSKCFRHALIQRGQRGDVPGQWRAGTALSRHRQLAPWVLGVLMRASLPRCSQSASGMMASIRHTGKAGADHGLGQLLRRAAQIAAGVGYILGAGVAAPTLGGHVVVGAGVHHTVAGVGVRQVIARLPAVEGNCMIFMPG